MGCDAPRRRREKITRGWNDWSSLKWSIYEAFFFHHLQIRHGSNFKIHIKEHRRPQSLGLVTWGVLSCWQPRFDSNLMALYFLLYLLSSPLIKGIKGLKKLPKMTKNNFFSQAWFMLLMLVLIIAYLHPNILFSFHYFIILIVWHQNQSTSLHCG